MHQNRPFLNKKVKASHTRHRALGPGADAGVQAVSLQVIVSHPPDGRLPLLSVSYLPSHRASLPFGRYQVILLGDRGTGVNNLPKVVTQRCLEQDLNRPDSYDKAIADHTSPALCTHIIPFPADHE